MWYGTYPARVAQAGVRLPPTLEADKPVDYMSITCQLPVANHIRSECFKKEGFY